MRSLHVSFLLSSTFLATVLSAQSPLTIVNNSFPTGAVGQNYAQALTATGGTTPYTWAATGQIPPGLVFNSVGTISGTPTVGGTYSFHPDCNGRPSDHRRQGTLDRHLRPRPRPSDHYHDYAAGRRRWPELQPNARRHRRNTALSMGCRPRVSLRS